MDLPLSRPTLRDLPVAGFASSAVVWGVLVAYLVATKLLITYVFPVAFERGANQDAAFSWPILAAVAVLGLAGIWLAHQTGFPAAIDPRITNRERFLYPALVGIGFGILTIVLDLLFGFTRTLAANSGNATFNIAFPGSVFVYTGGAISVEALYRIFPLPLLVWLISSLILRGRGQFAVFWTLVPILALWEPVSQASFAAGPGGGSLGLVAVDFASVYAFNVSQSALLRRSGFLAPIVARWADYLVWHISYGNFICHC